MVEEKVVETLRFVMMQKILAPPLVGVGEQGREDQCHQREREREEWPGYNTQGLSAVEVWLGVFAG